MTALRRISAANMGPQRSTQSRTFSWRMSIPRSCSRSSALRSGKASPAHSCSLANFFVGDPNLKQVVAQTVEAGLRGGVSPVPAPG